MYNPTELNSLLLKHKEIIVRNSQLSEDTELTVLTGIKTQQLQW